MPQDQLLNLLWPRGGFVDSNSAFSDNDANVTLDALNVRNYDVFDRRNRGGKRSMLSKEFASEVNGTATIQLMREVVEAVDLIQSAGFGDAYSVPTVPLDTTPAVRWSPDGTRVLITNDTTTNGQDSLRVYTVSGATLTLEDNYLRNNLVSEIGSTNGVDDAVWSADGSTIYLITTDRVAAIPYSSGFGTGVRLNPSGTPGSSITGLAITGTPEHLIITSTASSPYIYAMPVSGTTPSAIITAPSTVGHSSNTNPFAVAVNEDSDVVISANNNTLRAWRFSTTTGWGTAYTDALSATSASLTTGVAIRTGTTHIARVTDSGTPSLDVNEVWAFTKASGFGTKTISHTNITHPQPPAFHPNGDYVYLAGPDMNDGSGTDSPFNVWSFSGTLGTRIDDPSTLGADAQTVEWNPAGTALAVSQGSGGSANEGLEVFVWNNPDTNPSARETRLVAVSAGSVYRSDTALTTMSLVSSGADAFRVDGPVDGQVAFQKLFLTDGLFANYQYLDFSDNTIKDWTSALTAGSLPRGTTDTTLGARFMEVYRGRTVLFGLKEEPQNWFMSAKDDPFDYDYFPATTSQTQAVAGNNADAGQLGDIVTACAPYQDDLMIMGGATTLWVMRGDPAAGGAIDNISRKIGIVGSEAWTFDTGGNFYFVGRNGLYRMSLGTFQPILVSQDKLDNVFLSFDFSDTQILLSYDAKWQGVHIFVSPIDQPASASTHYFYDERNDAFWPDVYPVAHGPVSILDFSGDSAALTGVLLGGYDGFIRRFDENATQDDGVDVVSYVRFAAMNSGQIVASNRMDDLVIIMDNQSSDVKANIYVGDTIEQAEVNADASQIRATKTIVGGRNTPMRRRITQNAVVLELRDAGTNGTRWAFERATARVAVINRMRGKRT